MFLRPSYRTIFIDSNTSRASKFVALLSMRISVSRDLFQSLAKTFAEGSSPEPYRGWHAAAPSPLSRMYIRRSENYNDNEG